MSQGQSRRPLGLLMAVVVVALAAGAVAQQRSNTPATPRQDLERTLDRSDDPLRYAMRYNRGGTRVLDCIAVNLRYTARVDTNAERMIITTSGTDTVGVIVESSEVLLRRTLFQDLTGEGEWFSFPRPLSAPVRQALTDALGVDLATTVTSDRLPASGRELVVAALSIARSVLRTGPLEIDGDTADGYRILVDRSGYEREGATLTQKTTSASVLPMFDVWINSDDRVRRVTIGSETADDRPGPPEDSWRMDFETLKAVRRPRITSSRPLNSADLTQLRAAKRGCELPIGRTDS